MEAVSLCNFNPNFERVGSKCEIALDSHLLLCLRERNPWFRQNDVVFKFRSISAYLQKSKLEKVTAREHSLGRKYCLKSSDLEMAAGRVIVLMGVSGAGKTTIGKLLAVAMNCPFLDADDFHSNSNKEKMRNGIPLSDEDRSPWLMSLRDALSDYIANGKDVVCACSALQKQYREILRSADPIYRQRVTKTSQAVRFVLLEVTEEVLAERVKRRREEEAHFMPAALLKSQLELLELDDSEGVVCIDGTQSGHTIVRAIQDQLCL
ncbi:hypothetical protein V2J09_002068 [Rumex salicifolius]